MHAFGMFGDNSSPGDQREGMWKGVRNGTLASYWRWRFEHEGQGFGAYNAHTAGSEACQQGSNMMFV